MGADKLAEIIPKSPKIYPFNLSAQAQAQKFKILLKKALLGVRSSWNGGRVRLCLSSLPLVTMYPHWVDILYKVQV